MIEVLLNNCKERSFLIVYTDSLEVCCRIQGIDRGFRHSLLRNHPEFLFNMMKYCGFALEGSSVMALLKAEGV